MQAFQKIFGGKDSSIKKTNDKKQNKNIGNDTGVLDENKKKVGTINVNGQEVEIPKEHQNASVGEQDDCPFIQMQKKKQSQALVDPESQKLEKKQKKPKGGCPFMPSEKKKNPGLMVEIEDKFSVNYISSKAYLLNCKGFNVYKRTPIERKVFDTYPIYIKHSLFHQDEPTMVKARKCEMSQKFFIFDQFREKGNKFFKKEDYHTALSCYEYAISVVRWVELLDDEVLEEEKLLKKQQEEEEAKKNDDLEEEEEKQQIKEKPKQQNKIIKKTKRGARPYSTKKQLIQEKKDLELKKQLEQEDSCEGSDYGFNSSEDEDYDKKEEEIIKNESQEERQKRIEEQERRQKELMEKAMSNQFKSSVPEPNDNDDISDCGSMTKGRRADSDKDWESEREEEEGDNDSTIAIGDQEDLAERKKELDREQRVEDKKKERLQELIKEQDEYTNDDDELFISMDKEKERQEKENRAKEIFKQDQEDEEFKRKHKLLLTTFTDENTRYFDGEELTDSHEIDMRQGMLITILLNLSIVYQKLGHFQNAREALDDAEKVAQQKCSQIYYRRSQAIAHDLSSTLTELQDAKDMIEFGMKIKRTEKMFQQEKGIMKILNLQDHEEAFHAQAIYVTDRIHVKKEYDTEQIKEFLERASQIEEVYQEMVSDGRIPEGEDDDAYERRILIERNGGKELNYEGQELEVFNKIQEYEDYREREIMKIMIKKFYGMIDFYMEQQKIEQVEMSQRELQRAFETHYKMEFYYNLDCSPETKDPIVLQINKITKVDFGLGRVQRRLRKLKIDTARGIYEEGVFNFHIMEYAIKEYYKNLYKLKNKLEEMEKKRLGLFRDENSMDQKPSPFNPFSVQNVFSMGGLFQMTFFMFCLLALYSFFKSNAFAQSGFSSFFSYNPLQGASGKFAGGK